MTPSSQLRFALLRRALPFAVIGGFALAPAAALAAMVQVTSPTDLAANDLIRYRQVVPYGEIVSSFYSPVAMVSNNGVGVTVSNESGPRHEFLVHPGSTSAETFDPTFGDINDDLLTPCCSSPGAVGDITLNFATPVRGFGAYVVGNPNFFIANVLVNGVSSFSASSDFSIPAANYSVFLGVLSDAIDIYSVTFKLTGDANNDGGFVMDNLRLNTTAPPPIQPPSSPTPEPAAWALMIVGFAGVGAALQRRYPQTLAQR